MANVSTGSAKYEGFGKSGKGHVSTGSGALKDQPYGFQTRFVNWDIPFPERSNLAAIDIHAGNNISHFCETGAGYESYVTCPHNCDIQ